MPRSTRRHLIGPGRAAPHVSANARAGAHPTAPDRAWRDVPIDRGDAGVRVDLVLLRHLAHEPGMSRARIQKWVAAGRVLERLVQGMEPLHVATLAIMVAVLLAAAVVAGIVPALRASRVDPVAALRQE